jgi:hypothetical protein
MTTQTLWEQPGWFDEASAYIRAVLEQHNLRLGGKIEQPHIRSWSTVLTIPTEQGVCYFKASASVFAHEPALTEYLSQFRPKLFPDLLAVDKSRHWMIMRDSGTPLRQFVRGEKSIDRWRDVVPLYVNLQKDLTSHVADLLTLGVTDRRLDKLPALFEELISDEPSMLLNAEDDSLTTTEYARVKESIPEFERMCERLASFGIPETIHHDDFHDANIFLQNGRIIFTDWGESAISHPFFTLVVMMRSVDNSFEMDFCPEADLVRDMYLEQWTSYAPLAELQSVVKLAQRIGYVNRALTWKMSINLMSDELKSQYAIAVPAYLKDYINATE